MTHTYHYLPEGNEITTRKSNPERRSLIVDEDTELQLPGGGYLGGSFIALGKAGWGWTRPHSIWRDTQGRQAFSGLQEKESQGHSVRLSLLQIMGEERTQSR